MTIKALLFLALQLPVVYLYYYIQGDAFINYEVAFFCSLLIMLGSMIAFSKVVFNAPKDVDDAYLESIEDPHALYDDEETVQDAEEIFKEEKKRIKKFSLKGATKAAPALFSLFRLLPYLLLALGMVALVNRGQFDVAMFLFGLTMGIICAMLCVRQLAYTIAKRLFNHHGQ